MEYFGEMLLRLKARARRDVNERKRSFAQHRLGELQPFSGQTEMRRLPGCVLERTREMRLAHVHECRQLLDLNALGTACFTVKASREFGVLREVCVFARIA